MMLTKLCVKLRQQSQTATTTQQQNPKPNAGTGDSFSPWSRQQVDRAHLLTNHRTLVPQRTTHHMLAVQWSVLLVLHVSALTLPSYQTSLPVHNCAPDNF